MNYLMMTEEQTKEAGMNYLMMTEKQIENKNRQENTQPSYYVSNGLEARKVIDAFNLNFNLGNVIKYTLRAGKKGKATEDLRKAIEYLHYEIERLEKPTGKGY